MLHEPCLIFASVRQPSDVFCSAHQLSFDSSSHFVLATPWTERISQGAFWIASPISKSVASSTEASLICSKIIWAAGKAPFPLKVRLKNSITPSYRFLQNEKHWWIDAHIYTTTWSLDGTLQILQCNFPTIWATNLSWFFRQELAKQSRTSTPNSSHVYTICLFSSPPNVSCRIWVGSGISIAREE